MYIETLNNTKLIFIGDINSINLEIIAKSHNFLVNKKLRYILLGDYMDIKNYFNQISYKVKIKEIFQLNDLIKFNKDKILVFNIGNKELSKPLELIYQINISNKLSKLTNFDLITMPINKSIIKKEIDFNGMTEYLELINSTKTYMMMNGDKFSIIPLTTHIRFKDINNYFNEKRFYDDLIKIYSLIIFHKLIFDGISVLAINPHAGESGTLGNEEKIIRKVILKLKKKYNKLNINGPLSADSAFLNIKKNQLFISFYHDQALIPFKILNKKAKNHTIGLSFNRFSPAHGTAEDIKFKNKSNINSFIQCMLN